MKKLLIAGIFLLSTTSILSAQMAITSIQNNQTNLLINDSISVKKGTDIQVYLPAGKDFFFVKQKKSGLSAKLIGDIAGIAGTGAAAVGIGSGNIGVMSDAINVMNKATAIQYGADAIDRIQDLPISKNAKKIAGKKMQVLEWEFKEEGYIIIATFDKKKYEINLQEAVMTGEIKL